MISSSLTSARPLRALSGSGVLSFFSLSFLLFAVGQDSHLRSFIHIREAVDQLQSTSFKSSPDQSNQYASPRATAIPSSDTSPMSRKTTANQHGRIRAALVARRNRGMLLPERSRLLRARLVPLVGRSKAGTASCVLSNSLLYCLSSGRPERHQLMYASLGIYPSEPQHQRSKSCLAGRAQVR